MTIVPILGDPKGQLKGGRGDTKLIEKITGRWKHNIKSGLNLLKNSSKELNQIAQSVDMKFEKSWALKGKRSYLALAKIIGSMDKPMDIAAFTNLGLNLVSVSSYVWGFTVPYPFLAVGATNLVYNIPYVRNRLDQTI